MKCRLIKFDNDSLYESIKYYIIILYKTGDVRNEKQLKKVIFDDVEIN